MKRRGTPFLPLALLLLGQVSSLAANGCSEVVEVLQAPESVAGSGAGMATAAAGAGGGSGGAGGAGASGGGAAAGGAQPANPALGTLVDSGDAHSCATRQGILYCWGAGADGRLGVGDTADRNRPTRVGFGADWVAVVTGLAHSCALKTDGSVWCFGASNVGQLGQGSTAPSSVPLRVTLPGRVLQLSADAATVCAVLDSGELWCWGRNLEGNIGLSDTHPGVDQLSPIRSGDQSDWKNVGAGDGHTCGVRGPGLLFGWGRNTAANLGLGQINDQQRRSATQIGTDEDWQSVVSGQDSSCGLRGKSGSEHLFCWGGNSFGNLGLPDTDQRLTPTEVAPDRIWTKIAIDTFHGCGIDDGKNLYCWGRGIEGQLGTGANDAVLGPALIGTGYAQVAVGRMSSCAVTSDDRIECTGENAAGQLGLGDTTRRNVFTEVTFP